MASVLAFSWCSLLLLLLLATASQALNVGDLLGTAPSGSKDCSRTCESSFCIVPPLLRYGKYCGILYSQWRSYVEPLGSADTDGFQRASCTYGCPGEKPCDALDACCMVHDHCVATHDNDYLNTRCNENLLSCLDRVSPAGPTFPGNECGVGQTASVIRGVIESAVLAGKILHKRDDGQ